MVRRKLLRLMLACGLSLGCFLVLATAASSSASGMAGFRFLIQLQWLLFIAVLIALRIVVTMVTAARVGGLRGAGWVPAAAGGVALFAAVVLVSRYSLAAFVLLRHLAIFAGLVLVALYFTAVDSDPEVVRESAARSPVRTLRRFAALLAVLLCLVVFGVTPALFVLRAKLDSALLVALAQRQDGIPCTYSVDYWVTINLLEQCLSGHVTPKDLGAELSTPRQYLYELGFKEFRESVASRALLRDALVKRLERCSGQTFGADVARWCSWLKDAEPMLPRDPYDPRYRNQGT